MSGIEDIAAERQRQIEAEGWTAEHDDKHDSGELAEAAACYARGSTGINYIERLGMRGHVQSRRVVWPWDLSWWKPTDRRRDLVKAGALIVAEIDRLDRAAAKARS